MEKPGTAWPRRRLLAAAGLVAATPTIARAEWLRNEIVVYCDPALRPVLTAIAARLNQQQGLTLRVFCAPPGQMLGLLAHGTQDDVLITLAPFMRQGEQSGLVAHGRPLWKNQLVFASRGENGVAQSFDAAAFTALIGAGKLAVPDPTPAACVDGPAVLQHLGLAEKLAGQVQGTATTGDALDMVRQGTAALALCHVSEVAAGPDVRAAVLVPEQAYDPIIHEVALSQKAWSRNQDKLLAYLAGAGRAQATEFGLAVLS